MRKNSLHHFNGVSIGQSIRMVPNPSMSSTMSLLQSKESGNKNRLRLYSPSDKQNQLSMHFSFNPTFVRQSSAASINRSITDSSQCFKKKSIGCKRRSIFQSNKKDPQQQFQGCDHFTIDLSAKQNIKNLHSNRKSSLISQSQTPSLLPLQTHQQNIKVYVRIRPIQQTKQLYKGIHKEMSEVTNNQCNKNRNKEVMNEINKESTLKVLNNRTVKIEENTFSFDQVFDENTQQNIVFDSVGRRMCQQLFFGYNGTIFAYGQTGSGKTYTIFGEQQNEGLIYRAISYILALRRVNKASVSIRCSMVQLYKDTLMDMLSGSKELKLKETKEAGAHVEGLKEVNISSEKELMQLVKEASKLRKVATTKINEQSSRSHTILNIFVQGQEGRAKLCLIDLAGSEKVNKSEVKGTNFEETRKINYSLSCLGNVINALTTRSKTDHIPFRDSKLTRILKDSLSGNFLTSIIVNCSSSSTFVNETISSLKFAERAKKVKMSCAPYASSGGESISYLRSVIEKLSSDLAEAKDELKRCRESGQRGSIDRQSDRGKDSGRSEVSGRFPIPSERANVDENIKKYTVTAKVPHKMSNHFPEPSSLNVSASYKFMESPCLSRLSLKQQENNDFSISFSEEGK